MTDDPAECLVRDCSAAADREDPPIGWTRDRLGRLCCPAHPAATACRLCGALRGGASLFCPACRHADDRAGERYDVLLREPPPDETVARLRERLATGDVPVRRVRIDRVSPPDA